jgi:hypothetical protein
MRYDGIYKGIVIQNNDPTNAGRVKVYVPEANATLLKDWNLNKNVNQKMKGLGVNAASALTPDIMQRLKTMLPWARVSMPVFGMSTSGFYDSASDTSYIGNDSNLIGQLGNKSSQFFESDRQKASSSRPLFLDPLAKIARSVIDLTGIDYGNPSFPLECGSSPTIPSVWKSFPSEARGDIKRSVPRSYPSQPANNFHDPEISKPLTRTQKSIRNIANNINDAIERVEISVVNPDIYIDGKIIDISKTIFNDNCLDERVLGRTIPQLSYEPPILFIDTPLIPIRNIDLENLPVELLINGVPVNREFTINTDKSTDKMPVYTSNNIEVVIPKGRVQSINIYKNNNRTDISKIAALKPFNVAKLDDNENMFRTILPRIADVLCNLSAGGGGAAAYNRVNTQLLPYEQRREALIGGNNPMSKENRNFGAQDSPENCDESGSNQLSKADMGGPYRPPDHSNNFKGMVSIPAPGAHVHVRFEDGNPNMPIVMDTFVPQSDYKTMYGVPETSPEQPSEPVVPLPETPPIAGVSSPAPPTNMSRKEYPFDENGDYIEQWAAGDVNYEPPKKNIKSGLLPVNVPPLRSTPQNSNFMFPDALKSTFPIPQPQASEDKPVQYQNNDNIQPEVYVLS